MLRYYVKSILVDIMSKDVISKLMYVDICRFLSILCGQCPLLLSDILRHESMQPIMGDLTRQYAVLYLGHQGFRIKVELVHCVIFNTSLKCIFRPYYSTFSIVGVRNKESQPGCSLVVGYKPSMSMIQRVRFCTRQGILFTGAIEFRLRHPYCTWSPLLS